MARAGAARIRPAAPRATNRLAAARVGLIALAAFMLGGCGGHGATVADCLNGQGFLVQQRGAVVLGSSPGGVNFRLTVYTTASAAEHAYLKLAPPSAALLEDGVVDFAGNPPAAPGGRPGKLSNATLARIRGCLARP